MVNSEGLEHINIGKKEIIEAPTCRPINRLDIDLFGFRFGIDQARLYEKTQTFIGLGLSY